MVPNYSIVFTLISRCLSSLGLLIFCLLLSNNSLAQKPNYSPLVCTVLNYDFMTKEGEVVSNVLSVKNENGIAREFYIEVGCPSDWKVMNSSKRVYNVGPSDSIFIPIRLLPNLQTMKGSTKYNVSVFVVGTDGQTYAVCSFQVAKPKRVDWSMTVLPRNRIYFLNDQYEASLGINVSNRGEEAQEVNLSWKVLGQGLRLTTDSTKQKNFLDLLVDVNRDTTINFFADLSKPQRNFRMADLENYRPMSINDSRKYTIYFRGVQPKNTGNGISKSASADLVKLNSAVDFIKLSNNYTVNSYGTSVIPLTWYSNVYNILGIQPIWMNTFNIYTNLKEGTFISGNLQHIFAFYSPSQQTLRGISGTLWYSAKKWDISLGQGANLRGEMMSVSGSSGNGISSSYRFTDRLMVSGFYARNPGLFSSQGQSYGAGATFKAKEERFLLSAGYTTQDQFGLSKQNNLFAGFRFRLLKKHNFTGRLGRTVVNSLTPTVSSTQFLNWLFSYSGAYLKDRLRQSFSASRNSFVYPFNASSNSFFFLNSQTSWYGKDKRGFNLTAAYMLNEFSNLGIVTQTVTTIPVSLQFNLNMNKRYVSAPSLTYTRTDDQQGVLNYGGVNFGAFFYDWEKNIRASANFMGGYNFYRDSIQFKPIFTANSFLNFTWRTLSLNIRYMYGPMGLFAVRNFHYSGTRYPQFIFNSLNYQYVFKQTRFVGEISLNHSWNNQTYSNNLFVAPNIYFFTKNGWRFNLLVSYSLNARNNERSVEFYQYQGYQVPEPEARMTYSNNFNISVGLRKQF